MNKEYTTTGQKLRRCREACALSQRQVAAALNIDRSTYTRYEIGDTEPNFDILIKLSNIFNVDIIELLPEHDHTGPYVTLRDIAGADSPIYQLNKEERGLIACFRALGAEQKAAVLEYMANISKKQA